MVTTPRHRLQRNLAELGLDPEPVTTRLYRELAPTDTGKVHRSRQNVS